MKLKPLFLAVLVSAPAFEAAAAELTLFGHQLQTVERTTLKSAAKAAGARLTKSTAATDVFDASSMGLPGAQKLEIVYLNNQVVMAQYKLEKSGRSDERFRKMLVAKYGYPRSVDDAFRGTPPSKFDQQYVGDSKYRWSFDQGMELVYSKEFFGDRYLTYLNKDAQAEMQRKLDAMDTNGAAKDAKAKRNIF